MNNTSPIPVKWARSSLAWSLLLEVLKQCHSKLYSSLITSATPPPPPLKKDTLTERETLVSATQACSSCPPPSLSSLPLPTQACDVTVWDNEVRILLQSSVSLAPICEEESHRALVCRLSGMERPLLIAVSSQPLLSRVCNALQSGRSRVDLRMTSREWQCLSQPAPTARYQSPKHKGGQRPQYFSSWRKHIFTTVIYIQEEGSALSAFYTNTVGQRQCGKGRQRRHTGNRFFEALCLTAEALIDKIQQEPSSHCLSLQKDTSLSCVFQDKHV